MQLTKTQIMQRLADEENEAELLALADAVRHRFVGDEIHLRGLIEFSNICRNNCLYCGIRRNNGKVKRYRMTPEEIIETARGACLAGFKTIVMQSGEDMYFTPRIMCRIISQIKKFGAAVTLSLGERSFEDYKAFREAGADRYLMRIETTDQDLYHRLDPQMNWQHRYECLLMLKELGYELGSGIMVGLPGQTIESIADDLLFLQNLPVDMAGIGPFIAHPETPLARHRANNLHLSLRTMALMRLLMPDINIPATTAMESLHPDGRIMALQGGANVIMPNVTASQYRKLYELYPGKENADQIFADFYNNASRKILAIGRSVGPGHGSHKKQPADS